MKFNLIMQEVNALPKVIDPFTSGVVFKTYPIDVEDCKPYLSKKGLGIVMNGIDDITVEVDEKCKTEEDKKKYGKKKKVSYHVQYMINILEEEELLTEEHLKKFCKFINICAENGDIILGSLSPLTILPLLEGRIMISFFPLATRTLPELQEKYGDWFKKVGVLTI